MKIDGDGDLLAHYAPPLTDETGVYMVFKSGVYRGFGQWSTLTWSVKKLQWIAGSLQVVWSFDSDWKPAPIEIAGWEPVFLPALGSDSVYVPGLGATVHRVSKDTGAEIGLWNPFPDVDPNRYVVGGVAIAPDASLVYDAVGFAADNPQNPISGAWLVKISAAGEVARADFAALVPGRPTRGTPASALRQRQRPASLAALDERGAAFGPVRRAAPRHQRRACDRARRNDLHAEPRPRRGPLLVPRRRRSRT